MCTLRLEESLLAQRDLEGGAAGKRPSQVELTANCKSHFTYLVSTGPLQSRWFSNFISQPIFAWLVFKFYFFE